MSYFIVALGVVTPLIIFCTKVLSNALGVLLKYKLLADSSIKILSIDKLFTLVSSKVFSGDVIVNGGLKLIGHGVNCIPK